MRILIDDAGREGAVAAEDLPALYAPPRLPWLRANMVTTLDGAASGAGGTSSSINDEADHQVFTVVRGLADAVLVGAGTAAAEAYGPIADPERPVVVVSGRARVPEGLRHGRPGQVLLATHASAAGRTEATALLGADHVLVHGQDQVDLAGVLSELHARGLRHVLCEGGPSLLGELLALGLLDEVCATVVPRLVGGGQGRITAGPAVDLTLRPSLLLEEGGTLLARWLVDA